MMFGSAKLEFFVIIMNCIVITSIRKCKETVDIAMDSHHLWKVSTGTLRLSILAFSSPGEKDKNEKKKRKNGVYHVLFCILQDYPSAAST